MTSRLLRRLIVSLLGSLAAPSLAAGQSLTVTGSVVDPTDGLPVRGVRVALGAWLGGYSDQEGKFSFTAPAGQYPIRLSCPRSGQPPLVVEASSLTLGSTVPFVELTLPGGRDCLPALEVIRYGEFDGVLDGAERTRLFRLCAGPTYRIALELTPTQLRELSRALGGRHDEKQSEIAIQVRGKLDGPGFFGQDGSASYLLEAETVRKVRWAEPAKACRGR